MKYLRCTGWRDTFILDGGIGSSIMDAYDRAKIMRQTLTRFQTAADSIHEELT